jgi:hypothetical protein
MWRRGPCHRPCGCLPPNRLNTPGALPPKRPQPRQPGQQAEREPRDAVGAEVNHQPGQEWGPDRGRRLPIYSINIVDYSWPCVQLGPLARRGPIIAVVGRGASGTLTVVHLLRYAAKAQVPLRVALIDRYGRDGLGQAYATTHPSHLLNSPADKMSVLAGDPGHLLRWADAAGINHDSFLPRCVYGRYLRETLAEAERLVHPVARVSHLISHVIAIRHRAPGRGLCLHLAGGSSLDADVAVLATCPHHRHARFPMVPGTSRTHGCPARWRGPVTAARSSSSGPARGKLRLDADPAVLTTATMASIQGGLLLTQVRRDPRQLRIALNAARNNLRLAAA